MVCPQTDWCGNIHVSDSGRLFKTSVNCGSSISYRQLLEGPRWVFSFNDEKELEGLFNCWDYLVAWMYMVSNFNLAMWYRELAILFGYLWKLFKRFFNHFLLIICKSSLHVVISYSHWKPVHVSPTDRYFLKSMWCQTQWTEEIILIIVFIRLSNLNIFPIENNVHFFRKWCWKSEKWESLWYKASQWDYNHWVSVSNWGAMREQGVRGWGWPQKGNHRLSDKRFTSWTLGRTHGCLFIKQPYKIFLWDIEVYFDNGLIRVEMFFLEISGLCHHCLMRCSLWRSELLFNTLFCFGSNI